ncbi:WD40 repeat domain-containing protein [Pseudoalteromonas xiamenensis]
MGFTRVFSTSLLLNISTNTFIVFALCSFLLVGCGQEKIALNNQAATSVGEPVLDAKFSGDAASILFLNHAQQVKIWSLNTNQIDVILPEDKLPKPARQVEYSKDGSIALVIGENDVAIFRVQPLEYIGKLRMQGISPLARITASALSENKLKFVAGMEDGAINMAQLDTGINNQFQPHRQQVSHIQLTNNGDVVYSGSLDGQIARWQFGEPKAIYSNMYQHRITSLALNKSADRVFVSDGLHEQQILDAESGDVIVNLDYISRFKPFREAYFDESGKLLMTTSSKSQITFWDLKSGKEIGVWSCQTMKDGATVLAITQPDKTHMMTVNTDGLIETWNLTPLLDSVDKE